MLFEQLTRLSCSLCHQGKHLYIKNPCPQHYVNIFDKKVQISCDTAYFFNKDSSSMEASIPNDIYVCKGCSTSMLLSRSIEIPQELHCPLSPSLKGIYHAMTTKFLHGMMGWSISIDNPNSIKFQFSPQRCETQNHNERLLHLFINDSHSELHYKVYILNSMVNIGGSLGKVEDQTIASICRQLYTVLKKNMLWSI